VRKQWVFLPRRSAKTPYNPVEDETKGTNLVIFASADFATVTHATVTPLNPERGFSSFKFVPHTSDTVVAALKTKEVNDSVETYITVFNIDDGKVLLEETLFDTHKFEGIEFI